MITPTTTRGFAGGPVIACLLAVYLSAGCSAVHFVERDGRAPGYLEVKVEPLDTEVHVDGRFRGTAAQWADSVMTLEAGHHRVRLSLDGHYTRRFDVRIRRGVVRRLEVVMMEKVGGRAEPARVRVSRTTYEVRRGAAFHVFASRVGRTTYDDLREPRGRVSRRTYDVRPSPRITWARRPDPRLPRFYPLPIPRRRAKGATRRVIARLAARRSRASRDRDDHHSETDQPPCRNLQPAADSNDTTQRAREIPQARPPAAY